MRIIMDIMIRNSIYRLISHTTRHFWSCCSRIGTLRREWCVSPVTERRLAVERSALERFGGDATSDSVEVLSRLQSQFTTKLRKKGYLKGSNYVK